LELGSWFRGIERAVGILQKQVRRAQRRLTFEAFVSRLAWCWFATFWAAVLAIAINKLWPVADQRVWTLGWFAGVLAVGLLVAICWTWAGRHDALTAAVEIDRRFDLKERVSSTYALSREQRTTPFAAALLRDAEQRVSRIDVAQRFRVSPGRLTLLPLAPAGLALVLAVLVGARAPQVPSRPQAAAATAQIKKPALALVKKLEETRKQAAEKGLRDALLVLEPLEEEAKSLAERKQFDKKQSLVELNDLVKGAEARRKELAGSAELKQQLAQLKNLDQGPAQKLGQALKAGAFEKARAELNQLAEQMAAGRLDAEGKRALGKQLDELRSSLSAQAEAQRQAEETLQKRVDSHRQAGNRAAAERAQQQLDKLAAQRDQMEAMRQLAEQVQQAGQQAARGENIEAAQTLRQVAELLEQVGDKLDEMEMLDRALGQVADAKNAMGCKECDGEGCKACQAGDAHNPLGGHDLRPGVGIGANRRGDGKAAASFIDSHVPQTVGGGSGVVTGEADGANRKGRVQEEIRRAFSGAEQHSAEALSSQRLPHGYRDHAKKYFDALREGPSAKAGEQ
jgi:hypothetical protein